MRKTALILIILLLAVQLVYAGPFIQVEPVRLDQGQGAGYNWWDSTETSGWAPSSNWWPTTNALGFQADDDYTSYAIPFDITLCGQEFAAGSNIHISSNGFVTFNSAGADEPINQSLPNGGTPNLLVAAMWDNLAGYSTGEVYADVHGSAPNRKLVISWSPWYFYGSQHDALEFQIVFYETEVNSISNTIDIQYKDVYGDSWRDNGASATIGLENNNGTSAAQYSFNQPVLADGLALRFVDAGYVRSQIGEFDLLTPNNGAVYDIGDNIQFTWETPEYNGTGNLTYKVYFDDSSDFDDPDIYSTGGSTQFNYVFGTGDEGVYYWKVLATESTLQLERFSDSIRYFEITGQGAVVETSWGSIKAENN